VAGLWVNILFNVVLMGPDYTGLKTKGKGVLQFLPELGRPPVAKCGHNQITVTVCQALCGQPAKAQTD